MENFSKEWWVFATYLCFLLKLSMPVNLVAFLNLCAITGNNTWSAHGHETVMIHSVSWVQLRLSPPTLCYPMKSIYQEFIKKHNSASRTLPDPLSPTK